MPQKYTPAKSLIYLLASLLILPLAAAAQPDPIIAMAKTENETILRSYGKSGVASFEVSLNSKQANGIIAGRFAVGSSLAVISGDRKIYILNDDSSRRAEIPLPSEPVNTVFASDFNHNGYADIAIIIHHASGRAKALVYVDPGLASYQPVEIPLPVQALYYSPAIAGTYTVGILAYSPKGQLSAASKRKAKRAKKKNKNKNKKGKAAKGKAGFVYIIDTGGKVAKEFKLKGADGQIYPYSSDGQCGFAIQGGDKLKVYASTGKLVREIKLGSENTAAPGNYSGGSSFEEIAVPQSSGLSIINMTNGAASQISLSGLPDQKELINDEIARLTAELQSAYENGRAISEIIDLRDKILELMVSRDTITTAANVASRLHRLFSGGAGSIEGVCDKVDETPNDGYGGFLVKNGDYSGKIVILTPGGKDYFGADLVKFGSYKVIQKLDDSGWGNPDSNGSRKHFRGNGTVQSIGKFIFRAKIKESFLSDKIETHCWYINKPAARID